MNPVKLEARRIVDQVLGAEAPCLGAVFCSYTFDPIYFEDQVLRTLLGLSGDPDEDSARYLVEARAALCRTPVACFVDAGVRQSGRKLPYDLHLVRARTFHPKVFLVLYEHEARLAVGSGNLTRSGLSENAELFFHRALRYDDPVDAVMLRQVDAFFAECATLAAGSGTQLEQVRALLARRLAATRQPGSSAVFDAAFVHSFEAPGLRWLSESLPADAVVQRIGVLSPFYERDDAEAADEQHGLSSILMALMAMRPGPGPALDLGVPWEDAPVVRPAQSILPELQAGLWARRTREEREGEPVERIAYLHLEKISARRCEVRAAGGQIERFDRELLEREIAQGALWPVARPTIFAPARIVEQIAREHAVQLWLHPSTGLSPAGQPVTRRLHAKLFLVTVARRGKLSTYALMGSANASRAALGRTVAENGNVEAGVLLRFEGEVRLHDVLPGLVAHELKQADFEEREAPAAELDLSAWIEDVVHHADARTLTIHWARTGPAGMSAWSLRYLERAVSEGSEGPPVAPTVVTGFELSAKSAELQLEAGGRSWSVPIRIADLTLLPSHVGMPALDLRALLALLGRRVSGERMDSIFRGRGEAGLVSALDAIFGEGFGAADVFDAWRGLREALSGAPTLAAFRFQLLGATGPLVVWKLLVELAGAQLSPEEIWLYGCELVRELGRVTNPEGPDRSEKVRLVAEVVASIRGELRGLLAATSSAPWLDEVQRFYGVEEGS